MPRENTLEIEMRARTRKFERDLDRARTIQKRSIEKMRRQVDRANRSMETSARRHTQRMQGIFQRLPIARIAAMATAALSVGSAFRAMYAQIDRVDALAKLARNLDVSARSLQGLRVGFDRAGVSNAELDRALGRFSVTIGEAVSGEQIYVRAFQDLGVELRNAQGELRSTEDLFFAVSDAVSTSGKSASELLGIFKDLFGAKIGVKLVDPLRQGSAVMREWVTSAERLGLVLGDDVLKALEELQDKRAEVNDRVNVAQALATKEWADELKLIEESYARIAETLWDVVRATGSLHGGESLAGMSREELESRRSELTAGGRGTLDDRAPPTTGLEFARDFADLMNSIDWGLVLGVGVGGGVGAGIKGLLAARRAKKMNRIADEVDAGGDKGLADFARRAASVRDPRVGVAAGGLVGGAIGLGAGLGGVVGPEPAAEKVEKLTAAIESLDQTISGEQTGAAALPGTQSRIAEGASITPGIGALQMMEDQRAAEMREQYMARQEEMKQSMAEFDAALEELTAKAEEAAEALESARKAAVKRVNDVIDVNFENALDSLIDGTKSAKEAFADMARSIIIELTKMIAKQLLFNALAAMFSGGATGMGTGPLGGQGFSIGKALGVGDFLGGLFAGGGDTMTNKPIVVGEQGPELFFPGSRGRVLSKAQAQQALTGDTGSGITVVQNMNFALGVQDTVRAEIENLRPQLTEDAKRGVQDAANRGQLNLRPAY